MNIKDLLKDAYKEGMTLEEIETALESVELPTDNSAELERLKNALSKSNSEASEYKKQLRERMSADEVKEKEESERFEKLQKDHEALLKKVALSENKSKFLALGYSDSLATETAEAMVNGEMDKVFANQKKHLESVEKKVRSDILKETPKPDGGNGEKTITKEEFDNMSYSERAKVYEETPEIYNQLTNGGNE